MAPNIKSFKGYPMVVMLCIFLSCSKKSDVAPENIVSINGTVYPTVTIGTQVWMTENYRGPGSGKIKATGSDSILSGDYYYKTSNINLPAGWRVPTKNDFDQLLSNYSSFVLNGYQVLNMSYTADLMSKTGWNSFPGTNATGFNCYPAGFLDVPVVNSLPSLQSKGDYEEYLGTTVNGFTANLRIFDQVSTVNNVPYYAVSLTSPAGDTTNYIDYFSLRFVKNK